MPKKIVDTELTYRKQFEMSHSTPPECSKEGKGTVECFCVRCYYKCTENTDTCPNCGSHEIKCLYSSI